MENICYGKFIVKDDEVIKAVKIVNVYEFIRYLLYGYKIVLIDGGVDFS